MRKPQHPPFEISGPYTSRRYRRRRATLLRIAAVLLPSALALTAWTLARAWP